MLKMLRQALKAGNATVSYPFEGIEQPKDVRGKPEHDLAQCIACAACASACPPNAIQMSSDLEAGTITWSINYGRCIFCGRCEEVCPTRAIRLSDAFELAVMTKSDLEETCTYALARCSACGEYFAPAKEVDYVKRLVNSASGKDAAADVIDMCPECRRVKDVWSAHEDPERG